MATKQKSQISHAQNIQHTCNIKLHIQGVTGGDKGLQGVTKDYSNFFLTRTFPDTFPWSILHKNQS